MDKTPQIVSVKQLCDRHSWLTEKSMRWLIYRADENGLAPSIFRIGRRVLIDERNFVSWLEAHRGIPALPRREQVVP